MSFSKSIFTFYILYLTFYISYAQPSEYKMTRQDYIEKYKDIAIKEMLEHNIPASITLAQGLLESDNGNSALTMYANNHFGIKCHDGWKGNTFIQDDDVKNECFRKYNTAEESFDDHSLFLITRGRYAFLFELKNTDYKGWAEGLKEAGYATNRSYSERLIKIIDDNRLFQYDRIMLMPIDKYETKKVERKIIKPKESNIRKIYFNNRIKYVVIQDGETYYKIAQELDMRLWQLHNYNEVGKQTCLQAGDIVYLQPKRKHSRKEEFHIVRWGETMYYISQLYGIKMKHLYRMNNMTDGQEPVAGQKIFLKKQKKK
ncbi:MAG: glucosaminidase domain-containing protein [Bacteroidota bacterium]